jgi:hypothetical protein
MVEPTSFVGAVVVMRSRVVLRAAVVLNALLLVGGFVAHRTRALDRLFSPNEQPAQMSSPERPVSVTDEPGAQLTATHEDASRPLNFGGKIEGTWPTTMSSSKVTNLFRGSDTQQLFLGSNKYDVTMVPSPTAPTVPPACSCEPCRGIGGAVKPKSME